MKKIRHIYSRCISLTVLIAMLTSITAGCGKSGNLKYSKAYIPVETNSQNSCEIASNDKFRLEWNSENQYVSLYDRETGTEWSTVPQSFLAEEETGGVAGVRLNSALMLDYYDVESMQMKTVYSAVAAVKNGNVSVDIKDGKLTVTYDFAKEGISVPIIYSLSEKGMKVSIDVKNIAEDKKQWLNCWFYLLRSEG